MNEIDIYDFDKTVYNGDSSVDFWIFCLMRRPYILFFLPWQLLGILFMRCGLISGAQGKSMFFCFLRLVNGEKLTQYFWKKARYKINTWFLPQNRMRDSVVCTASPEFLVSSICSEYGVTVIGTRCNIKNGYITGANCKGPEKVRRLLQEFQNVIVNTVYSDSIRSDAPIFELAKNRICVTNGKLQKV